MNPDDISVYSYRLLKKIFSIGFKDYDFIMSRQDGNSHRFHNLDYVLEINYRSEFIKGPVSTEIDPLVICYFCHMHL